ncbi:hypothetical protein VMT65_16435 [Nocardia sp. CDC153]|uniref:hypothetical protein n=1 Tax=Nocardia sp. CDC153 TaxID=3112167 RepID=UPI002DB7344C|nr:hypothetical protein [Nocardia sp. CDC153]MEC3954629.1 hypothetical protein [Nocardia sp. CDC153]
MGSRLAESLRIDQADAMSLANSTRAHGQSLTSLTEGGKAIGAAAAGVGAGFAGFRLGAVCAERSKDTAEAVGILGKALERIGNNTVLCVDAFHHTDNAVRLNIVNATTHLPNS